MITAIMPRKSPSPAYVLGVGLTKFLKPRSKVDYTELGFEVDLPFTSLVLHSPAITEP
jgi:hypothetical protein